MSGNYGGDKVIFIKNDLPSLVKEAKREIDEEHTYEFYMCKHGLRHMKREHSCDGCCIGIVG